MKGNYIVIVDYGMGNLHSVIYKIGKFCTNVIISSSKDDILQASKIILPGVGHFASGMNKIIEKDLHAALDYKALEEKVPILGICLGMQLMTNHSEEGDTEGLCWISANTKRFDKDKLSGLKVPHMGWNSITLNNNSTGIMKSIDENDIFYFVHSYYVECKNYDNVLCTTDYGITFHSGIVKDNIFGFQFHPEKSHDSGIKILKNFIDL